MPAHDHAGAGRCWRSASSACDLIRQRLELLLRESDGIEHTTLQMEEEADGGLLEVENAPG